MQLIRHPGNKLFRRGELTVLGTNQRVRILIEKHREQGGIDSGGLAIHVNERFGAGDRSTLAKLELQTGSPNPAKGH